MWGTTESMVWSSKDSQRNSTIPLFRTTTSVALAHIMKVYKLSSRQSPPELIHLTNNPEGDDMTWLMKLIEAIKEQNCFRLLSLWWFSLAWTSVWSFWEVWRRYDTIYVSSWPCQAIQLASSMIRCIPDTCEWHGCVLNAVTIISSRNLYTLAVTTRRGQTDALSGQLTWNPFKEWTFLLQKQAFKRFCHLMCNNCWIEIGFNLNTYMYSAFFFFCITS